MEVDIFITDVPTKTTKVRDCRGEERREGERCFSCSKTESSGSAQRGGPRTPAANKRGCYLEHGLTQWEGWLLRCSWQAAAGGGGGRKPEAAG
jgi:hypothetical protein